MKILLLIGLLFFIGCGGGSTRSDVKNSYLVSEKEYHIVSKSDVNNSNIFTKRGDYVTASIFGDENTTLWAKRFNIAEIGGIDDGAITKDLLSQKGFDEISYVIGYDWMPGVYYHTNGNNREFVNWLYENRFTTTLNPDGPFIHCEKNGYDWCEDYYYNYGNEEVLDRRVDDLLMNMRNKGLNGVFFDWASGRFLFAEEYQSIFENFKELNPNRDYLQLVGNFYKKLNESNVLIVTNQAFRSHEYLLPYVTYDMTESYITTDKEIVKNITIEGVGEVQKLKITDYYPIYNDSTSIKDSLHFIELLTGYKKRYKRYGFKNFIYMNYLAPEYEMVGNGILRMKKPKNGIYFSYAMAKLTDNIVYAEVAYDRTLEQDDIYFYDLGEPLDSNYTKLDAIDGYIRFYENGFALVSEAYDETKYLQIFSGYLANRYIYDAYNDIWLKANNGSLVVKLDYKYDIMTLKNLPLGRVYLYGK